VEFGLTQEELAGRIDRTPETISNIERGKSLPSLATLDQIGSQLKRPIRDFFDHEKSEEKATRRRVELELRLQGLIAGLSEDDLEVACEQIQALTKRADKKGLGSS